MKFKWILAILLSLSVNISYANCQSLVGVWNGFFILKKTEDCKKLKGCVHKVSADVNKLTTDTFEINVKPSAGHGGILHATCQNSKISIIELPNSNTTIDCKKYCYIRHESDELKSSLTQM